MAKRDLGAKALRVRAKRLLELLRDYDFSHSESPDSTKLMSLVGSLEKEGLIADIKRRKIGAYVLRNAVHGSPVISLRRIGEMAFLSLLFARTCKNLYSSVYERSGSGRSEEHIQILKVIE